MTEKNLYAYCDNNPVMRKDDGGEFWDTIFDVVSLAISVVDVIKNPTDPMALAGLAADMVCLAMPGLTGGGSIVKAVNKTDDVVDVVNTVNKVDNVVDTAKTAKKATKIHGNSLKTTKPAIGYAIRKNGTNEIMKYGETTRGVRRYSKKFYTKNDVWMDPMVRGSKYDMHYWQHDQIVNYYNQYGHRPPWNKSFWLGENMYLVLAIEAQNGTENGLAKIMWDTICKLKFITDTSVGLENIDNYGTEFRSIAIIPTCLDSDFWEAFGWKERKQIWRKKKKQIFDFVWTTNAL